MKIQKTQEHNKRKKTGKKESKEWNTIETKAKQVEVEVEVEVEVAQVDEVAPTPSFGGQHFIVSRVCGIVCFV